jgi:ribosomal subunit interface protein
VATAKSRYLMRLELTGRHITITPAIRRMVEDRLAPTLRMLNDSAVSSQVVLTKEKARVHAEITLHARGEHFLHSEASGRDLQTALASSVDKIDRQAQRLKSKWSKRKRQGVSAAKAGSAVPRPERAARAFGDSEGAAPDTVPGPAKRAGGATRLCGGPAYGARRRGRARSRHPRPTLRSEADVDRPGGTRGGQRRRRVSGVPERGDGHDQRALPASGRQPRVDRTGSLTVSR